MKRCNASFTNQEEKIESDIFFFWTGEKGGHLNSNNVSDVSIRNAPILLYHLPLSYVEPLTSKEVPRAIEFGSHVLIEKSQSILLPLLLIFIRKKELRTGLLS